jgi:hypothetical protein
MRVFTSMPAETSFYMPPPVPASQFASDPKIGVGGWDWKSERSDAVLMDVVIVTNLLRSDAL